MSDEIEEFLRRAAQRRAGRRPPPVIEILEPEASAPPVARQVDRGPSEQESSTISPLDDSLDTSEFDRRASELGGAVGKADDKLEAHLHETFDHSVGRLREGRRPTSASGAHAGLSAAALIASLKSPQEVRKAIILSEILTPPFQRW